MEFLLALPDEERLRVMPGDIHMLGQLFPVLKRVPEIAARSMLRVTGTDARQLRYRAIGALRELLTTLSQTHPVILFIDDLQWGDGDSAVALQDVLEPPHSPKVLFLGSFRSDEVAESAFLNDWRQWQAEAGATFSHVTVDVSAAEQSSV